MRCRTNRTTKLTVERLETRALLSAVADIVFIVDESESQDPDGDPFGDPGNEFHSPMLQPWIEMITPKLEAKLVSRGVGCDTQDPNCLANDQNRYGMVSFGARPPDTNPVVRALRINGQGTECDNGDLWGQAGEIGEFLSCFKNDGGTEDGWRGVVEAIGVDGIGGAYEFRPDAAVHFILVTDEHRQVPQLDPLTTAGKPFFYEILDQLRAPNLNTGQGNPAVLSDAIVTAVARFNFDEVTIFGPNEFGSSPTELFEPWILGVDIHMLDSDDDPNTLNSINLDANNPNRNDDKVNNSTEDDLVVFTHRFETTAQGTPGDHYIVDAVRKQGIGAGKVLIDDDTTYDDIRDAFANPCEQCQDPARYDQESADQDEYLDPQTFTPVRAAVGQDALLGPEDAEEYAFLAWEARGTAWDFDVLREAWNGNWVGLDDPDELINMFNRAFVDDTFEKILLQRADFDGILDVPQGLRDVIPADAIRPGEASTGDIDMVTWYILNPPEDDPNTPNVDEAEVITRALDLDDSGTITDADRDHVISKLFATWYGDANLNGLFDSADANQVNQAGEYEDATEDNSGWSEGDFNGDLDFFSNDWIKAYQTGGYEWQIDGVDNDGDGVIDETWDNLFDGVDNDGDGFTDESDEGDTEGYRDVDGDKIEDFLPIWAKHLSPGSTFYRPSWGTN